MISIIGGIWSSCWSAVTDTSTTCANYDCHKGKEVETPSTVNNSLIQDYACPDDYANSWHDSWNQTIYNKPLSSYLLWMRYVFCFPDFPIKRQREKKKHYLPKLPSKNFVLHCKWLTVGWNFCRAWDKIWKI